MSYFSSSCNSSTVFESLISAYPTWDELSEYITTTAGGNLVIVPCRDDKKVVIRYSKGVSTMSSHIVRAFRSVVWDTVLNRPVSVTPFKSAPGESCPARQGPIVIEDFVDGVIIGQFWDADSQRWRIHTRSNLDAQCNYYSTRTFADLFGEASRVVGLSESMLDRTISYTWILMHPENRVVCSGGPSLTLVSQVHINPTDGRIRMLDREETPNELARFLPRIYYTGPYGTADFDKSVRSTLMALDTRELPSQGVVFYHPEGDRFRRWKMRTPRYNYVRMLRGNTSRRDYLWLDLEYKRKLHEYTRYYPEELNDSMIVIRNWNTIAMHVFRLYTDIFKARTMDKSLLEPRYRALVYALHNYYVTKLKPAKKSVTFKAAMEFLNSRDTAQKVHVLNWEINGGAHEDKSSSDRSENSAVDEQNLAAAADTAAADTAAADTAAADTAADTAAADTAAADTVAAVAADTVAAVAADA
jgi:hypothetical protein